MKKILLTSMIAGLLLSTVGFAETGRLLPGSAPIQSLLKNSANADPYYVNIINNSTFPVYLTVTQQPSQTVQFDHAYVQSGPSYTYFYYPDTTVRMQVFCSPNPIYTAQMDVVRQGMLPPGPYYKLEIPASLCTGFKK